MAGAVPAPSSAHPLRSMATAPSANVRVMSRTIVAPSIGDQWYFWGYETAKRPGPLDAMGTFDRWRTLLNTEADGSAMVRRSDPGEEVSAIATALATVIAERAAAFTMSDALKMPPVIRAVSLITSTAASFLPLVYRDGSPLPRQPRITAKPDPFRPRYEHVAMSVRGLIEDGCAIWWHPIADRDTVTGLPMQAILLPHDEVEVQWADPMRPLRRVYDWRGQRLGPGQVTHITIDRRPGELHGRGPLREGLRFLAPIAAAEEFAADFFRTGGIPSVYIKALGMVAPTPVEAAKIKSQWIESRQSGAEPAVFGKDFEPAFPGVDPQKSQLQESRAYGATVVARLLGIPAALLHVETSGATIVYSNPAGALEDLVKATVAPVYLAPLEAHWSELVPDDEAVRFDLADMQRADFAGRIETYAKAIGTVDPDGVPLMTSGEARAAEGWAPRPSRDGGEAGHAYDPAPAGEPAAVAEEVPVV